MQPRSATLVECPACGMPAEIVDRRTLSGWPAPVPHVKLRCVAGHWLTAPADHLLATPQALAGGRHDDHGRVMASD